MGSVAQGGGFAREGWLTGILTPDHPLACASCLTAYCLALKLFLKIIQNLKAHLHLNL
jgi:hypothetical protein